MAYLSFEEKIIDKNNPEDVTKNYNSGFLFTRIGSGVMQKTRSIRIDLSKYSPTSENKRILRKNENVTLNVEKIPYEKYNWEIGKIGKDFYEKKFGEKTFSAQKIKELMTDIEKSNFNKLFVYTNKETNTNLAYTICYENQEIIHYSYPFYNIEDFNQGRISKDIGMGMMTNAVQYAKASGKKYIYLGSLQRPADTYKLQFEGLEWLDEGTGTWSDDLNKAKEKICQKQ